MVKRLSHYIGNYHRFIWFGILCIVADVACEMMIPLLMAKIVDRGIPAGNLGFIAQAGAAMLILSAVSIGMGIANAKFSSEVAQGFAANLRRDLFHQIQSFSFANMDSFSNASLITRMTSDVNQLQNSLLMSLRLLIRAPLMLITALFIAVSINLQLSLVIISAIALLAGGILLIIRSAEKLFTALQQRLDEVNQTLQENLIAIRVVKAFVRAGYERCKFGRVNLALTQAATRAGNLLILIMPLMMLAVNGAIIAIIWFGGNLVGNGVLGAGELMSFISYLMQIMISIIMFSMVFVLLARAEACGKRVLEVIDTKSSIQDFSSVLNQPVKPLIHRGKIEFRQVKFKYEADAKGREVLSHISFTAEPGELVGIIGATGSAKTSLVNLIPRFYEVSSGQILIDDRDVKDYRLEDLRSGIGMVLQQNNLFTGTIRANLLWGKENASDEEIIQAARLAQAHEFIMNFPDGYDTMLGQGGINLSGGQKQRLCIARAMLKNPPILILDDSTSAVDTATEAKIYQAFRTAFKDSAIIIVAQRISSIKAADKIIVLDDGKISGLGSHAELLTSNPIYQEIFQTQSEGMVA